MGQHKHRHDDVFGDRRLVAEHVANGDPFWHRGGIEEVETGRHRLQQAKARRGREPRAPDMTDHDLRIRQQRGKLFYIALIVEDRGVQRRLHLGENSRPDRGGEMAKKQGFHMLPLPTHDERHDCGASASLGKEFESRTRGVGMSVRGTLLPHDPFEAHVSGDRVAAAYQR